jgi:hypothetical protein
MRKMYTSHECDGKIHTEVRRQKKKRLHERSCMGLRNGQRSVLGYHEHD